MTGENRTVGYNEGVPQEVVDAAKRLWDEGWRSQALIRSRRVICEWVGPVDADQMLDELLWAIDHLSRKGFATDVQRIIARAREHNRLWHERLGGDDDGS